MRVAAAAIIVIGIGLISYILINKSQPKELIVQSLENVMKETLPDGSVATLNKKSSLTYPSRFKGNKRAVILKGEAFFNVTPDKEKPFVIQANNVEITVVGTSFNVKTEGASTEVVVETGIVRVTKEGKTIELRPGERTNVSAESGPPVKEQVTDKLYNYYRTREFVCDDTPLWKLIEVVNEAYDVNIVIARNELRNQTINVPFHNESLDQVLKVISLTLNITVEKKEDRIILK
jgi:ferric-dicitrate binding protein FerR (iron transport regulator)